MSEIVANLASARSILELKNIVQEFPAEGGKTNRVIHDISMDFTRPSINMLLGPSGCGKSTLLRMMGGVRPFEVTTPTSGSIFIDGHQCFGPHDDAVMVFQRYANRPDLSVYENIAFPFRLNLWKKKISSIDWKARVESVLEAVERGSRFPGWGTRST